MTPPIRIRRHWPPEFDTSPRNTWSNKNPWCWDCCEHNNAGGVSGFTATWEQALTAGLAHLAEHTETT